MREVFFIYSVIVCTSFRFDHYETIYVVQTNAGSEQYESFGEMPRLAQNFVEAHLHNIRDLGYIGELGRIHIIERWKTS